MGISNWKFELGICGGLVTGFGRNFYGRIEGMGGDERAVSIGS